MEYRVYQKQDFDRTENQAGIIEEIATFPKGASLAAQDFSWCLNIQSCTQEETAFTEFPQYDRVLMVLDGDVVLAYEGQRVVRLKGLEQDRFDGAFKTKGFGQSTHYNLLVKKGGLGFLDVIELTDKKQAPEQEDPQGRPCVRQGFYCHEGYCVVALGQESRMIRQGEQLVVSLDQGETADIGVMGEGLVIRSQIFHEELPKETVLEQETAGQETTGQETAGQKAGFADFAACMKLSLTNFRGSRYIFRSLQDLWYDESLKAGIRKVERFYLPMLLWFAGMAVFGLYGGSKWQAMYVLAVLIGWTLLVLLVLSPLMYFIAVPKPVKDHIKKVDRLNKGEAEMRQEELQANPMAERILKKYEISGRNVYIEDEKPRRRKKN